MADYLRWWPEVSDPEFDALWEGCRQQQLRAKRCSDCLTWAPYISDCCRSCGSLELIWQEVGGSGTVCSHSQVAHAPRPELADATPYTLLQVDLDEGVRLVAQLRERPVSDEQLVGRRVRVGFRSIGPDDWLYVFDLDDQTPNQG